MTELEINIFKILKIFAQPTKILIPWPIFQDTIEIFSTGSLISPYNFISLNKNVVTNHFKACKDFPTPCQ